MLSNSVRSGLFLGLRQQPSPVARSLVPEHEGGQAGTERIVGMTKFRAGSGAPKLLESDFVQEVRLKALVIIDDDEDELGAKGYPSAFRT